MTGNSYSVGRFPLELFWNYWNWSELLGNYFGTIGFGRNYLVTILELLDLVGTTW